MHTFVDIIVRYIRTRVQEFHSELKPVIHKKFITLLINKIAWLKVTLESLFFAFNF